MVSVREYEKAWNRYNKKGKTRMPEPGKYLINDKKIVEVLKVLDRSRGPGYDSILLETTEDSSENIDFFWIDILDWWDNAKKLRNSKNKGE